MATQLLLIEDVEDLGHKGEIVNVRPGYARNFLLPQGLAVVADKRTLRMQERLKEERKQKAAVDKKESEEVAAKLQDATVTTVVKVDHEGHMYGSVSANDIVELLQDQMQVQLEKKNVQLKHPIKTTGVHPISIKLKEGVTTTFNLKVMSEEGHRAASEEAAQQ
jgi:large subunit ribosomal protein L9